MSLLIGRYDTLHINMIAGTFYCTWLKLALTAETICKKLPSKQYRISKNEYLLFHECLLMYVERNILCLWDLFTRFLTACVCETMTREFIFGPPTLSLYLLTLRPPTPHFSIPVSVPLPLSSPPSWPYFSLSFSATLPLPNSRSLLPFSCIILLPPLSCSC